MPRTRQGHCTPGTTGVLWVRGYRGDWATVPTGPLWVLGHRGHCTPSSGLQQAGAQAGWATAVKLSYRTATACTPLPPCAELGWAGPGSPLQTRLKGERWVSGAAGGRREERGWALPKNWIFSKFFLKIQSYSVFSSFFTLFIFSLFKGGVQSNGEFLKSFIIYLKYTVLDRKNRVIFYK